MFPNGTRVIVRSNQAGVYVGVVVKMPTDSTVTLATGTRQIHYWSAGGSVPQVAECGIASDGSRVTAPSSAPIVLGSGAQVVQVCQMTDLAWSRVQAVPVWSGGLRD